MAHPRDGAGQMDFDYDNKVGPAKPNNPWAQSIQQNQAQSTAGQTDGTARKRKSPPPAIRVCAYDPELDIDPPTIEWFDPLHPIHPMQQCDECFRRFRTLLTLSALATGPFSTYDSPQKSSSSFGDLRSPSGDALFSRPTVSGADAAFMTPRASRETEIPSSGPETSPDNADTDATPDTSKALIKRMFFGRVRLKFKGAAHKLTVNPFKTFTANRGNDGQHSPLAKHASGHGGFAGIAKRRRKNSDKERKKLLKKASVTFDHSDEDDDDEPRKKQARMSNNTHQPSKPGLIGGFFDYIHARPDLPATLSRYAQLLLNVILIVIFVSLIYSFIATIRSDVDKKAAEARADVLKGIAQCAKSYTDNGCHMDAVVPALQAPCQEWKTCMEKDEDTVGRAKVSAHTFAEIFNEFVEPISWKAFGFCVVLASVVFVGGNGVFMLFRRQMTGGAQQQQGWTQMAPTPYNGQWMAHTPQGMGYDPRMGIGYFGAGTPGGRREGSPVRNALEPGPSGYYGQGYGYGTGYGTGWEPRTPR